MAVWCGYAYCSQLLSFAASAICPSARPPFHFPESPLRRQYSGETGTDRRRQRRGTGAMPPTKEGCHHSPRSQKQSARAQIAASSTAPWGASLFLFGSLLLSKFSVQVKKKNRSQHAPSPSYPSHVTRGTLREVIIKKTLDLPWRELPTSAIPVSPSPWDCIDGMMLAAPPNLLRSYSSQMLPYSSSF